MNDAPIIYRYGLRYPHEGDKAIIVDMATNEVMFKGDIVARLNELETQLATEREAKMHETKRAQTLMQERNEAQRNVNENYDLIMYWRDLFKQANAAKREYRADAESEGRWAKQYLEEREAAREDAWALAFSYNQLYITSDLGGWRGGILERLGLAYQIARKYLKDGER